MLPAAAAACALEKREKVRTSIMLLWHKKARAFITSLQYAIPKFSLKLIELCQSATNFEKLAENIHSTHMH